MDQSCALVILIVPIDDWYVETAVIEMMMDTSGASPVGREMHTGIFLAGTLM